MNVAAAMAAGEDEGKMGDVLINRLGRHKVKVQDLSFSPTDRLIASLGGQDDNQLIIWSKSNLGVHCAKHRRRQRLELLRTLFQQRR